MKKKEEKEEVVEELSEEELKKASEELAKEKAKEEMLKEWVPKTTIGKKVLAGEITSIEEILLSNKPILEPEIVDYLLDVEEKVVEVKKTTRVVRAGRKFSFRATVLVGDRNGHVGVGTGKHSERWPAIRKAARKAKMNLITVRRGCGSWECACGSLHSIPFKVEGKCASVKVVLLPAPKGVGLVVGDTIKDVMEFAGIKDVWSKTFGATDTRVNFVRAAIDALRKTRSIRFSQDIERKISEIERKNR